MCHSFQSVTGVLQIKTDEALVISMIVGRSSKMVKNMIYTCKHSVALVINTGRRCTERFHSRDQRPYLFNETKESFCITKSSTPTGLVWYTNMADFSLFRYTNMADMTSHESPRKLIRSRVSCIKRANP